jgi:hypothetical protein
MRVELVSLMCHVGRSPFLLLISRTNSRYWKHAEAQEGRTANS